MVMDPMGESVKNQLTVTDRIIEKKKWENARALPGHLQVGKKNKRGLLVPGYFPAPG